MFVLTILTFNSLLCIIDVVCTIYEIILDILLFITVFSEIKKIVVNCLLYFYPFFVDFKIFLRIRLYLLIVGIIDIYLHSWTSMNIPFRFIQLWTNKGDLFELIGNFSINDGKYGFLKDIQTNLRINIILIIWKIISPVTEVT